MVDKQQFFLPCFVVCAIFSAIISAQSQIRVDTDPAQVVVTENQRNVSLMCRVGRPIQFCTFTLPSSSQQVALTPGQPAANGLQYFGEGYQKGQCGVTIDRITTAHNGQVKCSVFVDGLSAEGLIDVVVAVSPSQPTIQLEPETTYFEAGKQITAHCVTTGGNPDPQLAWFLENDPIYDGVDKQQDFEQDGTTGTALTLRRIINGNDNGKRLICQARHLAYPEGSSQTSLQLAVSFPPLYLPEHTIHGLTLGRTVDVTLVIEANPKPRTHWTVDGVGIEEGTEQDRFAARVPEQLESGAYNVTLTIAGLTLEDLTKKYTLRASNDFGVQDYTVMLSSLDAEVDESGGVGIGGIIGIVLAALIVLAAVALILVARATGRWCFRGKSTSTSTSNARIGETSDTESADLKQPITKTQRLKILFGRKRAEATGEIADNELAGAPEDYGVDPTVEGKRPATSTTTTTTTTPTKDEPTIVYAELELKPSEHSYVAKPESTEYAEILYVQKPGDSGNDGARIPVVVTGGSDATPATDGDRPASTTTAAASSEKK
ncbi:fasciclin-3 isoform X1 [Culex pipiens pallens]|uniref:fasciclin-3 isoform X1 n=1 Tax=Culex pipiens pallens TaxID=42434 RepID=UPI001952CFC6|nr:fasciclin-3 isoform X1 [Culex pipiens pallens]